MRTSSTWTGRCCDARAHELYADWQAVARDTVAVLRMEAGQFPDDEELASLIEELTVKSDDFGRWWAKHDVLVRGHGVKPMRHPVSARSTSGTRRSNSPGKTRHVHLLR